jgi:hypothetical protein
MIQLQLLVLHPAPASSSSTPAASAPAASTPAASAPAASTPAASAPVQGPQNLIVAQDPALLNYFQKIERSTVLDLDRDLKNAGIDDDTIVNMNLDQKKEYVKLIRELNVGTPLTSLVGGAKNPKFADLLDNRFSEAYRFAEPGNPPALPPVEELWRRKTNLQSIPSSGSSTYFKNLKQLNPYEKFALLHVDNRPGVAPRYKNQGAEQYSKPIIYRGNTYLQSRTPSDPRRLVA